MNKKQRTIRGFTLIELLVAVAILVIVLSFAGVIFRVSIDSHRLAIANAEIMQKLRAITDQLNSDFKGLRKDGEVFVVWVAKEAVTANYDSYRDCDNDGYERFDRIMFFADGDFQSYRANPVIRGDLARICYMLARNGNGKRAEDYTDTNLNEQGRKQREKERRQRILARTQHILTADADLPNFDPTTFTIPQQWSDWNNRLEYDKMFLEEWKSVPWPKKQDMLSVIADVKVESPSVSETVWGAKINPADPCSIHMLLCEGVGEFKVQGWYDAQPRWVPEVDPDGNGNLTDSDFFIGSSQVPRVLYPYPPYGLVSLGGVFNGNSFQGLLNEASFNFIPGLGRALKFTFTLYDSKGVIKNGRTFTHIVYLGD